MVHEVLNVNLYSKTTFTIRISSIQVEPSKSLLYLTLIKIIFIYLKLFDTWIFDSYLTVIQNRMREKYKKIKNIKHKWCQEHCMKIGLVAVWDYVRKLNALKQCYLAWILMLWDETLVQEKEYLASHFCCFSGIMLHRNLKYLWILQSANC